MSQSKTIVHFLSCIFFMLILGINVNCKSDDNPSTQLEKKDQLILEEKDQDCDGIDDSDDKCTIFTYDDDGNKLTEISHLKYMTRKVLRNSIKNMQRQWCLEQKYWENLVPLVV